MGNTRKVYVVIPVFNRLERTQRCVELLHQQSYNNIEIVVCDGGSTDGTPEYIETTFPTVTVLRSKKETWWGGSTRLGVDYALSKYDSNDFLMIMNDDTSFGANYIEHLAQASQQHVAALCGVVVREDDTSDIMDVGVDLNWKNFSFKAKDKTKIPENGIDLNSSVLPGRGTIFPMWAVKFAGTIDDKRFPHYLSDYEFSYRVKAKSGIKLGVLYSAVIMTEYIPENEGVVIEDDVIRNPFSETLHRFKKRVSNRAKQNLPTSLAFIKRHAPSGVKKQLISQTWKNNVKYILSPLWIMCQENPMLKPLAILGKFITVGLPQAIKTVVIGPYLVPLSDLADFDLEMLPLAQHQILVKSRFDGYFVFKRPLSYVTEKYPAALPLYERGKKINVKLYRILHSRKLGKPFSFIHGLLFGPYWVTQRELLDLELDFLKLRQHAIVVPTREKGYFSFARPKSYIKQHYPEALVACKFAAKPSIRFPRLYKYKIQYSLMRLKMGLFMPKIVSAEVCVNESVSINNALKSKFLQPSAAPGYYILKQGKCGDNVEEQNLLKWASSLDNKIAIYASMRKAEAHVEAQLINTK